MKSLGGPSELSVLVGSSSNQNTMEEDEPKLEDFLGGNSFSDHDHKVLPAALTSDEYMFSTSSFQAQDGNVGSSSNSIGLSVIKTWLRNQPIPQQQANDMAGGGGTSCSSSAMVANAIGTLTNSQGLSLSMSTGSQPSSALPLLVTGVSGGGESSSSDNKQKGIAGGADAQTGPTEAAPRKAVDTFGQRTSIYRGAAEAYDIAAIKFRGLNAVTNFDMSRYDVKSIVESNMLPVGGAAKRLKDVGEHAEPVANGRRAADSRLAPRFDGTSGYGALHHQGWPTTVAFHQPPPLQPPRWGAQLPYGQTRGWCKQEVAAAHGLQDLHQLHLGTNTHNFFQPSSVLHHSLVSVDASSMEHSTIPNSVVYGGSYHGGGYVMPMTTVVTDQSDAASQAGCGNLIDEEGTADPYSSSRNAYYLAHQLSSGNAKAGEYEQHNAWMQAPGQAMASRSNGMAGGHGAPPFTVWNDA
ncbi:hypothetical protein B296_00047806 [Ensete ventricosum]|uniref:AP2/ERF domain-containing protein n=1 Tax=Ensete ventricosum TaxID=4639 RepID=A0A426YXS1_ENSVE|nr:hypothetical protein B296_00047806 [Ensete ventricosum]